MAAHLRHARLQGFRDDKAAADVVREMPRCLIWDGDVERARRPKRPKVSSTMDARGVARTNSRPLRASRLDDASVNQ